MDSRAITALRSKQALPYRYIPEIIERRVFQNGTTLPKKF